jgi:signal transduction histidine kinase
MGATLTTAPEADEMHGVDERIATSARVVGLGSFETPSLEAVERRRSELWATAILAMVGLALGMLLLSIGERDRGSLEHLAGFRVGLIVITVGFAAYVLEKERHLRRLTALLMDERVLTAALSNRLKELAALLDVGKAVNSTLDLETVLGIILGSALDLLDGSSGSIMLLEDEERLRVLCQVGNESASGATTLVGHGIAGQVAAKREPMLITGTVDSGGSRDAVRRDLPVTSAISVPLINRGELLGVLNVNGGSDREFTEYDLRSLTLFAEHAAISIANARLYEAERVHVAELVELDRLKSDFLATVSHELRTPLTAILGCARTMQRRDLAPQVTSEFIRMIDRQGTRLMALIDDILDLQRAGVNALGQERIDLVATLTEVVRVETCAGRNVTIDSPSHLPVVGDRSALERVFTNLVDNAVTHGGGDVEIVAQWSVDGAAPTVQVSVLDRGPGVDPSEADLIFDRFGRGADSAMSRPGIGLGLHLVRTLVEAHGGRVWVEGRQGGGAAFHVVLPEGAT